MSFDTVVSKVTFNSTASEKGLADGVKYKVRLTASNNGGPPLNHTIESAEVLVDRSPPDIGDVFNKQAFFVLYKVNSFVFSEKNETIARASDKSTAGASWTGVVDAHSDVSEILQSTF